MMALKKGQKFRTAISLYILSSKKAFAQPCRLKNFSVLLAIRTVHDIR